MPTYQRFEDLPAWNAATDVAVEAFRLTSAASFRFKGDLVNQLRRAALSIANNIASANDQIMWHDSSQPMKVCLKRDFAF